MQRKQGQWKELFHVKEPFSAASSGKQQTAGCILRFQRRLKKIPAVRENTSVAAPAKAMPYSPKKCSISSSTGR
ncbi:hypothetical protein [Eisenbergiella tayi]|uniref:hypothetical protein n=1 Tax=Eisenbergiella tayi TaxID=1432052 RepID=UPI00114CC8D9|nr:hypothetical protein [Eisenbergiella tayi]